MKGALSGAAFVVVGIAAAARLIYGGVDEAPRAPAREVRLPVSRYADKVKGGWLGQMVGVTYGEPTEFRLHPTPYLGELPPWEPRRINRAFGQDDLYVDMTYLRCMETNGLDVSPAQIGKDFAATTYWIYHANNAGRGLCAQGILPPWSGHPLYNKHFLDIDFQIESEAIGLVSPGLPQACVDLSDRFGHVTNWGDGVYGGLFVSGMLSAAFLEDDPANVERIILAGLALLPEESDYYKCIRDVLDAYHDSPDDWTKTFAAVEDRWGPQARRHCMPGIDAKINGAYIVIGLLHGGGDFWKTIEITTRCGRDSDCNPASAGGVLGVILGYSRLRSAIAPVKLDKTVQFDGSPYTFDECSRVTVEVGKRAVLAAGGRIEGYWKAASLVIPIRQAKPMRLEAMTDEEIVALRERQEESPRLSMSYAAK
jgi:hypothetical protein